MEDYDAIINNDPKLKDIQLVIKQNESHLPKHPALCLLVGPTACGKTNVMLNLLFGKKGSKDNNCLNYSRLFVFTKDLREPKYVYIQNQMESIAHKIGVPLDEIYKASEDLADVPKLSDLDDEDCKNKMSVIIFDDMINEKNQDMIKEFYKAGRKKNFSIFYLGQSYHRIPIFIRQQANYVCLWQSPNKRQINNLAQDLSGNEDNTTFRKIVTEATKEPYSFLVVDVGAKDKRLKYRKGFTGIGKWDDQPSTDDIEGGYCEPEPARPRPTRAKSQPQADKMKRISTRGTSYPF